MQRWLIAAVVTCVAATGCSDRQGRDAKIQEQTQPEQAGAIHPLITAGHLARAEVAGLTGDQRSMRSQTEAIHAEQMRSMHLADPARRIDHEAARAALRPLAGVQSSVWVDDTNLLVLVSGSQYRNMATIDRIRLALQPPGDTLGHTRSPKVRHALVACSRPLAQARTEVHSSQLVDSPRHKAQ